MGRCVRWQLSTLPERPEKYVSAAERLKAFRKPRLFTAGVNATDSPGLNATPARSFACSGDTGSALLGNCRPSPLDGRSGTVPGRTHARISAVPCAAGPGASCSGVAVASAPVSGPFASACGPTACPSLCRNTGIETGTPAWGDSSTPCGDPGVFVGRSSRSVLGCFSSRFTRQSALRARLPGHLSRQPVRAGERQV